MLRRAPQGFAHDTWRSIKVGAVLMVACVFVVAVVYAEPVMHRAFQERVMR